MSDPNTAPVPEPAKKQFNEKMRQLLRAYATAQSLTNAELGDELGGIHPTLVSRYLNGKPDGNVVRLEAAAADVIKNAARRREIAIKLFPTNVSLQMNSNFETIRKTNDFAVITGPAGGGKTCGIHLYVAINPTALFITMTAWQRNVIGMESILFGEMSTSDWSRNEPRATYMARKLKNSNRLIIVDNAHRLTNWTLNWFFDFHDETGCPVALVGNPEILKLIRTNDQRFSRVGLCDPLPAPDHKKYKIVEQIVTQIAPEANGYLNDAGAVVVEQHGHLRALRKQVSLAREIRENTPGMGMGWEEAFEAAHLKLIRNYRLVAKK